MIRAQGGEGRKRVSRGKKGKKNRLKPLQKREEPGLIIRENLRSMGKKKNPTKKKVFFFFLKGKLWSAEGRLPFHRGRGNTRRAGEGGIEADGKEVPRSLTLIEKIWGFSDGGKERKVGSTKSAGGKGEVRGQEKRRREKGPGRE